MRANAHLRCMDIEKLCQDYLKGGDNYAIKMLITKGHRNSVVKKAVTDFAELQRPEVVAEDKPKPTEPLQDGGLLPYYNPTRWPEIDVNLLSVELRKKYLESKKIYVECKRLHTALEELEDRHQREAACLTIVVNMQNISRVLAECRFYIDKGEAPTAINTLDENNPIAVWEALQNARTYVSRYKKKPEKAALLKKYQDEVERLKQVYERLKTA
jgi:hypothetical protein